MERSAEGSGGEHSRLPRRASDLDAHPGLLGRSVERPHIAQEVDVGRAAAHEDVLAIVDLHAGFTVDEGVGAAAEVGPSLDEGDPVAGGGQAPCRSHAGESAPGDDDTA